MPVQGLDLQTRINEFVWYNLYLVSVIDDVDCDIDEALDKQAPCSGIPPMEEETRLLVGEVQLDLFFSLGRSE